MIDRIIKNTAPIEKALDAAWLRNELISQNIANVDTPGYKRKTASFEEYLSDAMNNGSIGSNAGGNDGGITGDNVSGNAGVNVSGNVGGITGGNVGGITGGNIVGIRTDVRHIPIGEDPLSESAVRISEDYNNSSMRLDGNNVDIDREMAELAKNSIKYNTLVQSLSSEFKRMKSAIREGKV